MRKLHTLPAALAVGLLTAFASVADASAQTSFATSNDPSATLSVEAPQGADTEVTITQRPTTAGFVALSDETVLRDTETGISYSLIEEIDDRRFGDVEISVLRFRGFDEDARTDEYELLDPSRRNDALYFTKVQHAPQ